MSRKVVTEILSFLFILLFVYAGASKLLDYEKFVVQIGQSPMLTDYSSVLAWLVPLIELGISLLLIFQRTRLTGFYLFFGLMIMFTVYIILASRFSDYVPCSCGGIIQNMSWSEHLVFNIVFVLLGLTAILISPFRAHEKHKIL